MNIEPCRFVTSPRKTNPMKPLSNLVFGRSRIRVAQSGRAWSLLASAAILISGDAARAAFHLWSIDEVYSSADGSVQFVEFSTGSAGQNLTGTHVVTCAGPQGSHSFTIP